ncbi:sarcosine oxidase subunit alpha family protein [Rhodovibrionaceae bacterium A322]
MTSYRLKQGGLIDRDSALEFSFNGKFMKGLAGDSLASALLANGQQLVGRSFKYHRPRGILTAGAAEPNALVTLGKGGRTEPNTRATQVELCEGLAARSQNHWPSLNYDIGALNGLFGPLLSAGFYYKTFMWPAVFWEKVYEPIIRRAAGLGKADYSPDPDRYEKRWAHCDLLVIGAGPAGLAAALTAARGGASVILADEDFELGGGLLSESGEIAGKGAADFLSESLAELAANDRVRLLPRSTVFGSYDSGVYGLVEQVQKHQVEPDHNRPLERVWRVVAKQAILASGAEERPLVFGGNDRPGVMMTSAIQTYLNRFAVAPGKSVALFGNDPSLYQTARDLEAKGVNLTAIIDARADAPESWEGKARLIPQGLVTDTDGGKLLREITVTSAKGTERLAVDSLGMGGGWSPIVHLACQRGDKPSWSEDHSAFLPPAPRDGLAAAGAAAGTYGLGACLNDGSAKANQALAALGLKAQTLDFGVADDGDVQPAKPLWAVPGSKGKAFVDFQNDVHRADLELAKREGYGHVELAKRYTTTGMATDQGKLSNINAMGILAEAAGKTPAEMGLTTFRPFYTPVSFGALAGPNIGKHFAAVRKSPLHGWAEKNNAHFVEVGLWYRSDWFPKAGETHWRTSVDREVLGVRTTAGICDVSTLGKIEIFGKDAAEFLNRVYCNAFLKLPVGKARYGLMLREDGFIYDDGTTSRLDENHYFMTTTTAAAAGVMTHLEFCAQALWPELDVRLASVSDQWAQMAVAGPNARKILAEIVDEDLSNEAFPFLAAREVSILGGALTARLFRISFSGELAYELAVPADYGEAVADKIMEVGQVHGILPYGTEALGVMRIEKGHITHAEINGTVTPGDLGFGRMVSTKKRDFIGRALLKREGLQDPERPQLVGVKAVNPSDNFSTGAHILNVGDKPSMATDQGHVTSMAYSPTLGHPIGLALVKHGPERLGEKVLLWNGLKDQYVPAVLCSPCFVDPENEKLHV